MDLEVRLSTAVFKVENEANMDKKSFKYSEKNPKTSTNPWPLGKPTADEDHVMWLKAPEQLLKGFWGECFFCQ